MTLLWRRSGDQTLIEITFPVYWCWHLGLGAEIVVGCPVPEPVGQPAPGVPLPGHEAGLVVRRVGVGRCRAVRQVYRDAHPLGESRTVHRAVPEVERIRLRPADR